MIYDAVTHARDLIENHGRCRYLAGPSTCNACFSVTRLDMFENIENCTEESALDAAEIFLNQIDEDKQVTDKCKSIW